MSFEVDEDILQDFLVEAGEILTQCNFPWFSYGKRRRRFFKHD